MESLGESSPRNTRESLERDYVNGERESELKSVGEGIKHDGIQHVLVGGGAHQPELLLFALLS